jgi:hypothetical protein
MKPISRKTFLKAALALASFAAVGTTLATPRAPTSWEIAREFSLTPTANSAWRYGWKNGPNNPFTPFSHQYTFGPNTNQQAFTSKLVMLSATDQLHFDVAAGPGNNYFYGSTGLHAVIERIGDYCPPTPAGVASPC